MDGPSLIIETRGLCKSYTLGETNIPVLFDIDFTLKRGEFAAIMGPSGSGKSTLLNILGCLDTPGGGEYRLNNRLVNGLTESELADVRRHDIGFVFQNFNLLPKLNIAANVELPLIYDNVPVKSRKVRVEETLRSLGLWERRHHRPNEISGGQKQRTAIARALVKRPALILADEPTGNLDSTTTREILALLKTLHENGNTLLIITHERDVAEQAQVIHHLRDGRLTRE